MLDIMHIHINQQYCWIVISLTAQAGRTLCGPGSPVYLEFWQLSTVPVKGSHGAGLEYISICLHGDGVSEDQVSFSGQNKWVWELKEQNSLFPQSIMNFSLISCTFGRKYTTMFFERLIKSYAASVHMRRTPDVSTSKVILKLKIVEQYLVGIKHF